MMKFALPFRLCLALTALPAVAQNEATSPGTTSTNVVPFEELHRLIRQHLADTSDAELNAAAVNGLIDQLKPHVMLGQPPAPNDSTNILVVKAERYRNDFGYLRVGAVRTGLVGALREAIDEFLEEAPLKGLVIDLRNTGGSDYAAAARAAGLFTEVDGPLLRVGETNFLAELEGEAILIPVMALTNTGTSGAAEALAAVLRNAKAGLIIGARSSGQATLYEDFTLSNGQSIRIASRAVQLGNGVAIPRAGLQPDIQINTTAAEDVRYLADPYWEAEPQPNSRLAAARRRLTEADLVRQRREGIPLLQIITNATDSAAETAPVLKDPALIRALDMLKALSVVQSWKKEE